MKRPNYVVTDGKLILVLEHAEEGGFVVTAPLVKGLNTQAETIDEAFDMAYDAWDALKAADRKLARLEKRKTIPAKRLAV